MDDTIRAAERVMKATGKALAFPERLDANARAFLGDAYNVARAYLNPWRDISTAPRDGTPVLLWADEAMVGHFYERWWIRGIPARPTLWAPLPPAPAA